MRSVVFPDSWLLRQGQHIRVDIILRALPVRIAWILEWIGDIVGLFCCLYFVWYGYLITKASYLAGSVNIKTLITPEWWTLAPLPVGFALLAIEFVFRMHRQRKNGNGSSEKTGTTRPHLLWPFFVFASYCLPSAIISGVPMTSLSAVKSYIRSWKDSDVPLAASLV